MQLMGETDSKQGHIHEHRTGFESKQGQNYESNERVWFERAVLSSKFHALSAGGLYLT